jgi:hypothetical protein
MAYPRTKIVAAKQATNAALDTLRDGVRFAVIEGTGRARLVYPTRGTMPADTYTRRDAKRAVDALNPDGGTAIGRWLRKADEIFAAYPGALRHAILLTDGKDESETPQELDDAIAACAGHFTADCRGVGTDWVVAELREVASGLLGTVDIVADPAGLEADFRAMTEKAMGKAVADVYLRLWTPAGARVKYVKQVSPTLEDLTDRRVESGKLTGDYPLGSWGSESRDYHVCVDVEPGAVGDEKRAAWVKLVVADQPGAGSGTVLADGTVRAIWTDDEQLSTKINGRVAHYTGQAELADVIQEGLDAQREGDEDTATSKFARAVKLADESGREDTAKLLRKIVDVDPATGVVRPKQAEKGDIMELDISSTKTSRTRGKADRS